MQLTNYQGGALSPHNFDHTQAVAQQLALCDLLPDHFRRKPQNIIIVLALARDLGISETQALSQISVIGGRPCMQATMMISLLKQSGKIKGPLSYEWVGSPGKPDRGCFATGMDAETGREIKGQTITLAMAQAEGWTRNAKYKTSPDNMLQWRAATFFIRAYYPEVVLGIHSSEEMLDSGFREGAAQSDAPETARERMARIREAQQPIRDVTPDSISAEHGAQGEAADEGEDSVFVDFLASIAEATDSGELDRAVEQLNDLGQPAQVKAARRAILTRAQDLGLIWSKATNCFVEVEP